MDIIFDSIFSFLYHKNFTLYNFSHDTHELIYFLSGKGTTTINDIIYSYEPNTICFTQVGDRRDHQCDKQTEYICIRFLGSYPSLNLNSGVYSCNNDEILSLFMDLKKEFSLKDYKYYDVCNLIISQILIKLSRLQTIEKKDINIYNLIKEIDNNISFNKSTQEMADSVSYSYDHFRHKFKEITGHSPKNYIINKRIEHACKLLLKDKYSCTDIAMICGFSSASQFTNLFKKIIGVTPKKYQLLINSENNIRANKT